MNVKRSTEMNEPKDIADSGERLFDYHLKRWIMEIEIVT